METDPDLKLIQERIDKLGKIFRSQMELGELDDATETNDTINRLLRWKHRIAMQKYSNAHFNFGAALTGLRKPMKDIGDAIKKFQQL